jgi:hypothetical protein
MWSIIRITLAVTFGAATLGCAPELSVPGVVVQDRLYTVTPSASKAKIGGLTGEVSEMSITEQVDKGSGRIISPALLSASLKLTNHSTTQTLRLIGVTVHYVDAQGKPLALELSRPEARLLFTTVGDADRLEPGKSAIQKLAVAFPAAALQAKALREIRMDLVYQPSPQPQESLRFPVSIAAQQAKS